MALCGLAKNCVLSWFEMPRSPPNVRSRRSVIYHWALLTRTLDIPFNRPWIAGPEFEYIGRAIAGGHLSGDGPFTRRCQAWLEERIGCRRALLANSCTAALEMSALLAG